MNNHYRLCLLILYSFIGFLTSSATVAQSIRGHVTDATTGSDLPGVSILVQGPNTGTVTDANGQYSLSIEPGSYTLRISFVGYTTQNQPVQVTTGSPITLDIRLVESLASLNEVVVIGSRSTQARSSTQTVAPIDVIQSRDLVATGQIDITQQLNFVAPRKMINAYTYPTDDQTFILDGC
ncbi:carboxypeptidase-like regulatory domain-containing protein [Spirosoma agri]|uniref:Carboxypeptidase-like regulatory domain-containing protein n=1 Tax=Spirosoma agri TaxID=1987381 RepID=A0A6M0IBF5_9BACT|nr:carboxypeptidase-like regulatory domain-containing protein [Spirosoma agri]NEU65500.1 carboxypeptidase-like regulatory domain-containing protein [Spirosoma agri]